MQCRLCTAVVSRPFPLFPFCLRWGARSQLLAPSHMYFESPATPTPTRALQQGDDVDGNGAFMRRLGLMEEENERPSVGRVTCVERESLLADLSSPSSCSPARRGVLCALPDNGGTGFAPARGRPSLASSHHPDMPSPPKECPSDGVPRSVDSPRASVVDAEGPGGDEYGEDTEPAAAECAEEAEQEEGDEALVLAVALKAPQPPSGSTIVWSGQPLADVAEDTLRIHVGTAFDSWEAFAAAASMLHQTAMAMNSAIRRYRPTARQLQEAGSDGGCLDDGLLVGGKMLWGAFAKGLSPSDGEDENSEEEDTTSSSFVTSEEDEEDSDDVDTDASPPRTKWRQTSKEAPSAREPGAPLLGVKRARPPAAAQIPSIEALPDMLRTVLTHCELYPLPPQIGADSLARLHGELGKWTLHALRTCCRDWGVGRGVLTKAKEVAVTRLMAAVSAVACGSWPNTPASPSQTSVPDEQTGDEPHEEGMNQAVESHVMEVPCPSGAEEDPAVQSEGSHQVICDAPTSVNSTCNINSSTPSDSDSDEVI